MLKAQWQAVARSVRTDVSSSDNLLSIGKSGSFRVRCPLPVPLRENPFPNIRKPSTPKEAMNILLTPLQLQTLLSYAAEMGAKLALSKTGHIRPYLKKSEAFKRYGRKNVEHWIGLGLITPRKDGNHSAAWRIDRMF